MSFPTKGNPSLLGKWLIASLRQELYRMNLGPLQFSRSDMSNSLWPHWLQHARPPCPSPTLRIYSNSCPLSRWCHPTISFSVVPFSFHLQSFPASGSFPMSQSFASSGQSIRVSASASVLLLNIQGCFLEDRLVWSPCCPRDSQESSPTPQFKASILQPSLWSNSHIHTWLLEKP